MICEESYKLIYTVMWIGAQTLKYAERYVSMESSNPRSSISLFWNPLQLLDSASMLKWFNYIPLCFHALKILSMLHVYNVYILFSLVSLLKDLAYFAQIWYTMLLMYANNKNTHSPLVYSTAIVGSDWQLYVHLTFCLLFLFVACILHTHDRSLSDSLCACILNWQNVCQLVAHMYVNFAFWFMEHVIVFSPGWKSAIDELSLYISVYWISVLFSLCKAGVASHMFCSVLLARLAQVTGLGWTLYIHVATPMYMTWPCPGSDH